MVVRIPCPIAGPSYLTTASEVATLEFAREVLKLPVPRVLAWSGARARKGSTNPVGVDHIMMEVAPGVQIGDRWPKMRGSAEVRPAIDDLLRLEDTLESVRFAQYGSLYFKEDVSAELQSRPLLAEGVGNGADSSVARFADKYRIGPLVDRQWWRGARAEMDLDRGPCMARFSAR